MNDIYQWSRADKLFAIEGFKQLPSGAKCRPLLQLVVDDDPVVRGKAALALQECEDPVLVEAADALIDQDRPEMSILALEILASTEGVDFSDRLKRLLERGETRVMKTAIEAIRHLPPVSASDLLERVMEQYRADYDRALSRLTQRWNHPVLEPTLKLWYQNADAEQKPAILRHAAALPSRSASEWVRQTLGDSDLNDQQRSLIRWILKQTSDAETEAP